MIVYLSRDIRPFVMYCVNGKPRSSLLIESTYRLYEERRYTDKSNCTRPTRNYYLHVHKEAVTKYMGKWARTVGADRRVLRDWEKTVHECIDERVRFLKQRWLNKRGKSP